MPKYVFECQDCNLRFERNLKMDGDNTTHACPKCDDPAPQVIEGFAFGFTDPPGAATANTGVHKHDYPTADIAVGRSADSRWAEIHEREKVKAEARKQGGTDALIRHNSKEYIDYEPMSDVGRKAHYSLAERAVAAVKRAREARGDK